ncbi:MAG: tetratricopeptide repeat protein [Anaerolineae bacterium]|nr:tetratricopeptide repeat protein [Anaerolineae bacterium]
MQIKRDYSQPFFSTRRRRRTGSRFIFMYGLLLGGFLVFVYSQFDRLQLAALDVVGMAPTPTPFASSWAQQGYDLYTRGKVEAAVDAFRQAVSQQPNNVNYLYEYGRMLLELDRPADEIAGRQLSDAEIALEIGDQAINAAPQDVRGYALKAKALIWSGDSASAIPIALQGREIDPQFAPVYSALAVGYTNIGRYQQGLDNGEQAVELDPMDADAHRSYAISLIYVGLRDEALRQLEDAVNINPNLVGPYFELAGQYGVANLTEEAVATYEKILTIDPRNAKAMLRMCELYFKVGEARQAEGYCDDALQMNPNYKEAYRQLGMVNYSRRNYEGSIENFNKCVDLKSEEIQCFYLRGLAHFYLADGKNEHCDLAWTDLKVSLEMVAGIAGSENILADIQRGLQLTTQVCPQYSGLGVPTLAPPTAIPPTPLGGLGG